MDPSLTTREITSADVPAIVRQRRLMFESMGYRDPARNDRMDLAAEAYLREAVPRGEYRGWLVTTSAGEPVAGIGVVVLRRAPTPYNLGGCSAYLLSLYVDPAYRRQGIARHLVQTAVDWAHAQGIGQVSLHASDQGRRLYESLGFQASNEMRLALP